ncbi:MAG: C-GCAxxG-C-C family protein [Desulfoprunum sp.]|nr:C-GCAxxG-C-C family protein [Desulfoprunum sp.]
MNESDIAILRLATQGFCCAQIMLHLALDHQGLENPGLLRAMSGLCNGLDSHQGPCGVLTGGACLIAYYTGKGRAEEEASDQLPLLQHEFEEWFRQIAGTRFGGSRCADIVSDGRPDPQICGGLLSEAFNHIAILLGENGFDLTESPEHD